MLEQIDVKPFFLFDFTLTLSVIATDVSQTIQFPSDADFLVQHIDVAIYDQRGAIAETVQVRDEVILTINDTASGNNYFNVQSDAFLFRRYSQSQAFLPFMLPARTQLTVTARITNFVNGGAAVGTLPYKISMAFIGRKIKPQPPQQPVM